MNSSTPYRNGRGPRSVAEAKRWRSWLNPMLVEAEIQRRQRNKIAKYFLSDGPFRRELNKPHLEFFAAGAKYRTRIFLAGNRTGKTTAGAYEITLHLTGMYPDWWEGKRFDHAIRAVVASDTGKTTREVVQNELLGQPGSFGTGMIPYDSLEK